MPPKAGPELYSRSGNSTESKPPSTPSKKDKGKEKETNDHSASATKPNATTTELRIECRRKNAPGVRLIAREPEKNGQIMAAYLCFETVTELKEFIASEGKCTHSCRTGTTTMLIMAPIH